VCREKFDLDIMLYLASVVAGYVLDLSDDMGGVELTPPSWGGSSAGGIGSDISKLSGYSPSQAANLKFWCPSKVPQVVSFAQRETSQDWAMRDIEAELTNIPLNCKDVIPWKEPCVPHDARSDPPGENGNSLYKCRWTAVKTGNSIAVDSAPPFLEWVTIDNIRIGTAVKFNCSVPSSEQLASVSDYGYSYPNDDTFIVDVIHTTNMSDAKALPYVGPSGGNVISVKGMLAPPASPQPPTQPPGYLAPAMPGAKYWPRTVLGYLYNNNRDLIHNPKWWAGDMPGPQTFWHLCYSMKRGDSKSGSTFHSKCDDRGETITIWEMKPQNEIIYTGGGYARGSWGKGNSYYHDKKAGLFSVNNNHHMLAGRGTQSTYYGQNSQYRYTSYGPTFGGGHDMYISSNMYSGYADIGHTYACRVGNWQSNTCRKDWIGSYNGWSINEIEVWSQQKDKDPSQL